jgi:fused signal recognition particle receptor
MDTSDFILLVITVTLVVAGGWAFFRRRRGMTPEMATSSRLAKTASALGAALRDAWGSGLGEATWDEIEEALLASDVGLEASHNAVAAVQAARPETVDEARVALGRELRAQLGDNDRTLQLGGRPAIVLVVGVNGTGKTTTIAKLANRLKEEGKSVVLAAADTFRAAAGSQLKTWAERLDVDIVTGQEGGDPASVAYDAVSSARSKGADVVIVDTAGRLHGQKNLMEELSKIHRVSAGDAGEVDEVLLVLDATGGQNGITQVKEFREAVPVSGIVLTKLDGTAKGGIVIAVERTLGVPVKLVGLGETVGDLEPFDPDSFVEELLEQS